MHNTATGIAFIGFGEVGQTFARGLGARDGVRLAAFDILFGTAREAPLRAAADRLGVRIAADSGAAARDADIVISAVTASEVLAVAGDLAGRVRPGQIVFDVNSASPNAKTRAAALIMDAGADYVEGAVMAPVLAPGLAVPILAGGPRAADLAGRLNALGMKITPVATEFGRASAMKLCRSIVVKGLEALMVDCAAATAAFGVGAEVFGSLDETWPGVDWAKLAAYMGERVATHGLRRAAEMREAADMLADLGISPALARAVADAQERGAKPTG